LFEEFPTAAENCPEEKDSFESVFERLGAEFQEIFGKRLQEIVDRQEEDRISKKSLAAAGIEITDFQGELADWEQPGDRDLLTLESFFKSRGGGGFAPLLASLDRISIFDSGFQTDCYLILLWQMIQHESDLSKLRSAENIFQKFIPADLPEGSDSRSLADRISRKIETGILSHQTRKRVRFVSR